MAETVGQHSVAAFTSPVNGTTPIDANTVRGNDNTVRVAYVDHDADPGIHVQSSTLASRPVAGTAGRKWVTVSSGRYQFWYDDGSRWHEVASDAVNVDCLADANLTKGDVIKITGFNNGQNLPTVNKVTSSTDVAFGLVENTVTSGNIVQIVNTGLIEDVDTNGYAVGTILYPNSSGGWTTTKPTSGNYQPAGFVLRGNSSNGVLYVEFSAPRIVERSDNTASTIVLRDASGNFAAGTITAGALTSTGLVTFASLKGTGATTVTNILDEDNMASDSATALATQQSIKAYVDAKVATVDTLAEVLANGNTTGANNIIVSSGQKITTNTIDETTVGAGVTIDSVLLKDDVVNATDIEVDTISANNGTLAVTLGSTGVATIAQQPILSSLTASQAVFTDASKGLVSNAITGTGNVVMSASPTLTGTVTAATINATTLGGTLSTAAQPNVTSVGTLTSLTVSGVTTLSAGTASAPALTTSGDTNNGLFFPAADVTAITTAGTERMRINSAGNIFIGNGESSASPANGLLRGTDGSGTNIAGADLSILGGRGTGSGAGGAVIFWTSAAGASGTSLRAAVERMRVTSDGNVGIGTTPKLNTNVGTFLTVSSSTASGWLEVQGNASSTGDSCGQVSFNNSNRVGSDKRIAQISGLRGSAAGSGDLIFVTWNADVGAERARITSGGEVLVGGTTALVSGAFSIQRTDTTAVLNLFRNDTSVDTGQSLGNIAFWGSDTTGNTPTILAQVRATASGTHAAGDNPTDIIFDNTPDGTETVAEAGRITQAGSYVLKGGTTTAAAGVGIIFPATEVASANANSLDDYEEGTWTPAYTASTSGVATYTSAVVVGWYTKVGNLVTVGGQINANKNTLSGNITITGLPFTTNANFRGSAALAPSRRFATSFTLMGSIVASSTSIGLLKYDTTNVNEVALTDADMVASDNYNRISFVASYYV